MVRDGLLVLPEWFTRSSIDDVVHSVYIFVTSVTLGLSHIVSFCVLLSSAVAVPVCLSCTPCTILIVK